MDQALGARYVLRERLGRGGMGTVYRASHRGGGPDRAVKMLHPNLVDDPAILARFVQERSIMLDLRSPHLVSVEDLVVDGDAVGIVMELVPGGSLRDYIARYAPLPPALALTIVGQILAGLVPVHAAKIVHRDLKPENVLLTGGSPSAPTIKVSDFGIARLTANPRTTRGSDVIGTPHYIAPELAEHAAATPAADVFAAGVILHELLTGATPHAGDTLWNALRKSAEAPPPPPPGVPEPVAALLAMWLDPRPHYRPANAAEALGQSEPVRVMLLGPSGTVPPPVLSPGAPATGLVPPQRGAAPSATPGTPSRPPAGWTGPPGASWPAGATDAGAPANQSGLWTRAPGSGSLTGGWNGNSSATPLYETTSTRVPAQRSPLEPGIAPRIPGPPTTTGRNRNQLWVLLAVGTVLLGLIGAGIFLALGPTGSKDPKLTFAAERYPQPGMEVTRSWELVGKQGASVQGTLVVTLSKGGPVDLDEVLPHGMVGATPTITPTPAADTVKPGPDPVFRYHLQGTPGQKVTVSYVVAVPPGPRTVGRLQSWATARNTAAAAYWQEKHQLGSLAMTPPSLQIHLPGPPQLLTLSGKQSDGSDAPTVALAGATWKSADPSVATVDSHGWVTGVGNGTTEIMATAGKATARAAVAVTAPVRPAPAATCRPIAPDAPTADVSGTTVTVRWQPALLPHCNLTGYSVTASPSGQKQDVGAGSTSIEFTSMAPGPYTFTVIADFGDDGSSPSSPSSASVEVSCDSVPPVSDLAARDDATGDGSVTVSWTNPSISEGCDSPDSYEIELDSSAATTVSSGSTSASIDVPPGRHGINVVEVMPSGKRIPGAGTSVSIAQPEPTDSPSSSDSSGSDSSGGSSSSGD